MISLFALDYMHLVRLGVVKIGEILAGTIEAWPKEVSLTKLCGELVQKLPTTSTEGWKVDSMALLTGMSQNSVYSIFRPVFPLGRSRKYFPIPTKSSLCFLELQYFAILFAYYHPLKVSVSDIIWAQYMT